MDLFGWKETGTLEHITGQQHMLTLTNTAEAHMSMCCIRESRTQHTRTHTAETPDSEQMLTNPAGTPGSDQEHWNIETLVVIE